MKTIITILLSILLLSCSKEAYEEISSSVAKKDTTSSTANQRDGQAYSCYIQKENTKYMLINRQVGVSKTYLKGYGVSETKTGFLDVFNPKKDYKIVFNQNETFYVFEKTNIKSIVFTGSYKVYECGTAIWLYPDQENRDYNIFLFKLTKEYTQIAFECYDANNNYEPIRVYAEVRLETSIIKNQEEIIR